MSNTALDTVIEGVLGDLPPPSPVADMPPENVGQDAPQEEPAQKRGRGRPRKTPLAAGAIPRESRPKLDGVKAKPLDTTPAASPGVEPAANVATAMVAMCGIALGGQDAAMTQQEGVLVNNTFIHYFTIKGVDAVPAWVILAGGLAPYFLRVLATPPARNKTAVMFGAIGRGVKNLYKRLIKGRNYDAYINRGDDSQRQDNPS